MVWYDHDQEVKQHLQSQPQVPGGDDLEVLSDLSSGSSTLANTKELDIQTLHPPNDRLFT